MHWISDLPKKSGRKHLPPDLFYNQSISFRAAHGGFPDELAEQRLHVRDAFQHVLRMPLDAEDAAIPAFDGLYDAVRGFCGNDQAVPGRMLTVCVGMERS